MDFFMYRCKSSQKKLPGWVDEIWRANASRIYKLCQQKCGCKEEADDLFQEVALRFCKNANSLDISIPVFPWLSTVMFRCRSDLFRRRMIPASMLCESVAEYDCGVEEMIPEKSPESELNESSVKREFDTLMQVLTPYEKMIVELSVVGGMTLDEVSRIFGVSKGSVSKRRLDAFEKMREKMKMQGEEIRLITGKEASLHDIIENAG